MTGSLLAQPGIKDFYFTDPDRQKVVIPFRQVHNLVVIDARINDSDTLRFILDTGVQTTLLLEPPEDKDLNLKYSQTLMVAGLGDGVPLPAHHSWGNTISLPGVSSANQDILVLTEHNLTLSESMGMKVHGVMGYDFFKSFDVVVNYTNQTLTLMPPGSFEPGRRYRELPITLHRHKPYLDMALPHSGKQADTVRLLLDMGAGHALSLYPFRLTGFHPPNHAPEALLGKGLSGTIRGRIARIDYITIGPFVLNKPVVTFPDTASVSLPAGDTLYHAGSVGAEVLRRFNVAISYRSQKVYLCPNRSIRSSFRYNTSGIEVATPYPGIPIYVVEALWPGSPAFEAGLEPGDQILSINTESVAQLSLPELIGMLNGKPGKRLRLTLLRNSVQMEIRFRLRDAI